MSFAPGFPLTPVSIGYRAGDLLIDVGARRVIREGLELEMSARTFDLLLALVRAAPNLVSTQELMDRVWGRVVIGPETVSQRIMLLRQGLGDRADDPRYILAVRGHGYRLLVAVAPLVAPQLAVAAAGPTAYQFFLQAESVVNGSPESFLAAIALYDAALARDPGLARAYSGRAMNRAALVWTGSKLSRGLEDAQADAQMALRLDRSDSRAHSAMANINALRGDWAASQQSFLAAIAASPSDADVRGRYAVTLLLSTGQLRAARAEAAEAQRLAPDGGFPVAIHAFVDHIVGADDEAVELADFAVSRGADPRPLVHVHMSAAARRGRYAEAAQQAIRMLTPAVLDVGGAATIRQAYAGLSDPAQRLAALGALRKLTGHPAWESADPRARQAVTYLYASLGAMDELYHEMNQMLRRGDDTYPQILAIGMIWAPEMRSFRQDRRFQDLVQRLGLMDYWKQVRPPDACTLADSGLLCK